MLPKSRTKTRLSASLSKRRRVTLPLTQVLIIVGAVLSLLGLLWWGMWSVLPIVLPVARDTHLVLEVPISSERVNTYLFALSVADHRVKVTDLPGLLPMSDSTQAATLQRWSLASLQESPLPKRAALSRALGIPIDQVLTLPFTPALGSSWANSMTSSDQAKKMWWQIVNISKMRIEESRRSRWSWWAFLATTRGEKWEFFRPTDTEEWATLRPKLQRAAAYTRCTVAVVNTTTERGLATELSEILENAGMKVMRVTDSSTKEAVSRIILDPAAPECQGQAELVSVVSPERIVVVHSDQLPKLYRANIVWLVGEENVTN